MPLSHAQYVHFSQPLYIPGIPSSPTNAFRIVDLQAGELNNDGKLDLVASFVDEQKIIGSHFNIYLGNGNGTFRTPTTYPASGNFVLKIGDIDRDGTNDIVTSHLFGDQIRILFGNGDGTFGAMTNWGTYSGIHPLLFEMGDFNGDSRTDIIRSPYNDTFEVMIAQGFRWFTSLQFQLPDYTWYLLCNKGDFNLDGKLDLLAARFFSSDLFVFPGNGDGTFQLNTNFPVGPFFQNPVQVLDLNNDNRLDVLTVCSWEKNLYAFLGQGDGTFSPPTTSPIPVTQYLWSEGPTKLETADFNGDGKSDVIINISRTNKASLAAILFGQGNGSFSNLMSVDLGVATLDLTAGGGTFPATVAQGDFNGDGKPDLVAAGASLTATSTNRKYDIAVLLNDVAPPPVSFALPGIKTSSSPDDYSIYSGSATGDLDNDNDLDILERLNPPPSMTNYPLLRLWLNNGQGSFSEQTNFYDSYYFDAQVADMDGDQLPDIIAGRYGGQFKILFRKADGTYESPFLFPASASGSGPIQNIEVGDFNGDGMLDVAGLYSPHVLFSGQVELLVYTNQNNRQFELSQIYVLDDVGYAEQLEKGDFDGDGNLDLAAVTQRWSQLFIQTLFIQILLGNGDGTFQFRRNIETTNSSLAGFLTEDINVDGKTDLLVEDGGIRVFLAGGENLFLPPIQNQYSMWLTESDRVGLADLNGDGQLDLAIPRVNDNILDILLGDGTGRFIPAEYLQWEGNYPFQLSIHPAGTNSPTRNSLQLRAVHAGDFNNDNNFDLAVFGDHHSTNSGYMSLLYTLLNTTKPNPRFDSISPSSFGTYLIFHGTPGNVYTLETSTNLLTWTAISTLTNQTGTLQFTDNAATNSTHRFYRARKAD